MRAAIAVVCLATLLVAPSTVANTQREGPWAITAVQWDAGTLLSWTPETADGAVYHVYRGTSTDNLVRIAKTSTPSYYDFNGDAGGVILYAVTIVVNGEESLPTYHTVNGQAACVSVAMNGSLVVRPYNCVPLR